MTEPAPRPILIEDVLATAQRLLSGGSHELVRLSLDERQALAAVVVVQHRMIVAAGLTYPAAEPVKDHVKAQLQRAGGEGAQLTVSRIFVGYYQAHVQKGLDGEIQVTLALSADDGRAFLGELGPEPTAAKDLPVAIVGGKTAVALGLIEDETRRRDLSLRRRSFGRR